MTPKKLRLRNFLSYGDDWCELDFDLFHIACITGVNGAGKSSLLEAIPWCLWGETPRGRNQAVIRHGARFAHVEFEFVLDETNANTRFKVSRFLEQRSSGTSQTLGFFVWDETLNDFRNLTGASIRATEAKIAQVIGIDYDTFINSSFLLQGRADEFTSQKPTDRKRVLADILQLHRYATISERAKEKRKAVEEEIRDIQAKIALCERQLSEEPTVTSKLQAAQQRQAELQAQKEALEQKLSELEAHIAQLLEKQAALQLAQQMHSEYEKQIHEYCRKERQLAQTIASLRETLSQREKLEQDAKRYEELRARVAVLDSCASIWQQLSLERDSVRNTLTLQKQERQSQLTHHRQMQQQLCAEYEHWSRRVVQLQQERQTLLALKPEYEHLTRLTANLAALRSEASQLAQQHGALKSTILHLSQQMNTVAEKGKQFKALQSTTCPLCQSPLTPEHRDKVLMEYRQEYQRLRDEKTAAENAAQAVQLKLSALQEQIAETEKFDIRRQALAQKLAQLHYIEPEIQNAENRLHQLSNDKARLEQQIAALEQELETEVYAQPLHEKLSQLQHELDALRYSPEEHHTLRQQLKDLEHIPDAIAKLKAAAEMLHVRATELSEVQRTLQQLSEHRDNIAQQIHSLQAELALLPNLKAQRDSALQSLKALDDERLRVGGEVLALQERVKQLADIRSTLHNLHTTLQREQEAHSHYEALEDIFHVDGIPAMLIENAVPLIEQEANLLLEKLTDNQMSLQISMQRPLQNQNLIDSLDIVVVDSTGTARDYATFSGGEKFRIDFSLRIALSKLLAAQQQVGVKMLVIDEGFGTQDIEGLEAIVDAINAVRGDFDKILLITHLDKLREAFETKIYVSKDAKKGSHFTVYSV